MNTLWQDLRYGIRVLAKTPGFTFAAIMALAIGIGANTAIFSVVYSVILKPLPYPDSERIVIMWEKSPMMDLSVSYPDFLDWRARSKSFANIAAFRRESFNLSGNTQAERVQARMVSWNFFRTFGASIPMGRDFTEADDQLSAEPSVILTHGLWQRRFGGDSTILGRQITLNDKTYTVIGVAPPAFKYGEGIELFTPIELGRIPAWGRGSHPGIYVVAKLKPGVSLNQARAEMEAVSQSINLQNSGDGKRFISARVAPVLENLVDDVRQPLWIMFYAVGFMLLIACTNVANLLLARSTVRRRELAIRSAMGATRVRVFRQLLTESVLLSVIGGSCGVLLAAWSVSALRAAKPVSLPRLDEVGIDPRVLAFTAAISILTGIVFGLAPALQASKMNVNELLKDSAARGGGRIHRKFRDVLVVTELALALVMLAGAGLTIKSLVQLLAVDPGFQPSNLLMFQMTLSPQKYKPEALPGFMERVKSKVAELPGITHVTYSNGGPMVGAPETAFYKEDADMREPTAQLMAVEYYTGPEYLETMGIRLVKGRYFTPQDGAQSQKVTVIDTTLAKNVFGTENPVGKHIKSGEPKAPELYQIVGVVEHVKHYGLDSVDPVANQFYMPVAQMSMKYPPFIGGRSFVLMRTAGDESAMAGSVAHKVAEVDPEQPVYNISPYRTVIQQTTETQRLASWLLGTFACIALLLASIGIYGVVSYSVTQRTHEIGVRMALGARRGDVLWLVLGQSLRMTALGLVIGSAAALVLTRYMKALLFNVRPADPVVFVGIAVILGGVALVASYIPARRATKVDPTIALRYE